MLSILSQSNDNFFPDKVSGEAVWNVTADGDSFISRQAQLFNKTDVQQVSPDNALGFHTIKLRSVPLTLDGEFICSVRYMNDSIEHEENFQVSVTGMGNNIHLKEICFL